MSERDTLLRIIFRRWPWKLLAIVLAYLIWLAVTGEARSLQDYPVPLALRLPEQAIVEGPHPTRVNVRLSGPTTLLRRLDPLGLEVQVDLRDAQPGERSVQLDPAMVRGVGSGLEVALIEPNRLQLRIARRTVRELPVAPSFTGSPPDGFELYGWSASPATVSVEGPEGVVAAMNRVPTDPISLDQHRAPYTVSVALAPESPDVRVVEPAEAVRVRVDVEATAMRRDFTDVIVRPVNGLLPVTLEPPTIRVSLSGPPRLMQALRADQLTAVVDVAGLTPRPEPYRLTPRIEYRGVADVDLPFLRDHDVARRRIAVTVRSAPVTDEDQP